MPDLLTAYRDHLIGQSIVRDPAVAGALPPAWRHRREGVPEPGEGNGVQVGPTAVIGLMWAGGLPAAPYESEWRSEIVDVVFRTTTAPEARSLHASIRRVTLDRRNWVIGGMRIMQTTEFRPFQPLLPQTQSFTFIWGVLFQYYDSDVS